jgi:transcriptional regulator with XRE-family HTH domain
VTPQQAGLRVGAGRRVPGLRREEVALLAGISADYYLRLERGRDRNPSRQVLEALARVLRLDDAHTAHLRTLADAAPRAGSHPPLIEAVPPGALNLLESLAQPAFIEGRTFDILAANARATRIDPRLVVGRNQLRDMFLDPAAQAMYPDWENVTECLIANLRQSVGRDLDDPRFLDLIAELGQASPRFRTLWALHEVRGQRGGPIRLNHPDVGAMTLNRERLAIGGAEGMMLVVYHPDTGSRDADKLALLGSRELAALAPED